MLRDVPLADLYVLLPVGEPAAVVPVGDVRICGGTGSTLTLSQLLMNELAKVMTDDDIVGYTGLNGARCMLIVQLSKERCKTLVKYGLETVHTAFVKNPAAAPVGGLIFNND